MAPASRAPVRRARAWRAIGAALALAFAPGCVEIQAFITRQPLQERVVYGTSGPKLLLLEIVGTIRERDEPSPLIGPGREGTVARVREQLDRAARAGVRGVLLRIDSPGGGAAASDLVYRQLLRFKQEQHVPVVAQLMGTATSGGYYVAMAADEVQAYPTTITGSIGVVLFGVNVSGLMRKLGVENQTFTSGAFKDAGSPLREMRGEERAHLQSVIDELHGRFRDVVAAGRPALPPERIAELADGRVYTGASATQLGLIDRVGTLEEALARLQELAGTPEARVVSYHRPDEYRQNLYTRGPGAPVLQLDLSRALGPMPRPGFHYLWWPGVH